MAITTALIYAALRGGSGPIWFGPAHCLVHSFFSNNTLMRVHNFLWTRKLLRVDPLMWTHNLLQVHYFFSTRTLLWVLYFVWTRALLGPQFLLESHIHVGAQFSLDPQIAAGPAYLCIAAGPQFFCTHTLLEVHYFSGPTHCWRPTIFSGPIVGILLWVQNFAAGPQFLLDQTHRWVHKVI